MNLLFNEEVMLPLVMLKMLSNIQASVMTYWIWIKSLKRSSYYIIAF
jgi:hypothetical protein